MSADREYDANWDLLAGNNRVFVCVLSVEARNGTTCREALCTCGGIDGKKDLLCMHNKAFRIEFKI